MKLFYNLIINAALKNNIEKKNSQITYFDDYYMIYIFYKKR